MHGGRRRSRTAGLEVAAGRLVFATDAQHDARAPAWALDGRRIYFELHHPDPVFGRRREVVRVAWVAAP